MKYLQSRKNLVGCLLALAGLALHFSGLIPGIEWLPITAALYAIGALLMPSDVAIDLTLSSASDAAAIRGALDKLMNAIRGQVPDDIYSRVGSIRDSILVTLGNGNGNGGGGSPQAAVDPNVYLIRQTAMSYLPEALNSYLALPHLYRDRSLAGRRSAHDVLLDQLNLMDQKLREVAEAIVAHDADRLEAHGRFIAEKFGGSALNIDAANDAPSRSASMPAESAASITSTADEVEKARERVR